VLPLSRRPAADNQSKSYGFDGSSQIGDAGTLGHDDADCGCSVHRVSRVEQDRFKLSDAEQLLGKLDTVTVREIDIENAEGTISYGPCFETTARLYDLVAVSTKHLNDRTPNRRIVFEQ